MPVIISFRLFKSVMFKIRLDIRQFRLALCKDKRLTQDSIQLTIAFCKSHQCVCSVRKNNIMYSETVQVFQPGSIIYRVVQLDEMALICILKNE